MEEIGRDNREKIYIQVEAPYKLKYESPEEFDDSFFHDAYTSAARIVRNIVEKNQRFLPSNKGNVYRNTEQIYNVVSFCGGRGTGKSSSMLSFMEYMKDYYRLSDLWKSKEEYLLSEDRRRLLFVGMECVDAGLLEEGEEIIEIILAKMLDKISDMDQYSWSVNDSEHKRRDFNICLKKMYDSLQNLRKKQGDNKKYWDDDDASLERLSKLAVSVNLRKNFKELVSSFLDLFQYRRGMNEVERSSSFLLISIDDIDMNLGKGYRMLEQIRRYLMVPQVVVLLSYDYVQLKSICDLYYSEELKGLNTTYKLPDEEFQKKVLHLTKSYMEKVVPVGTQVILPSLTQGDSIYHRKICLIPVGVQKNAHWSIRQTFQWKAAKCFAIYSCFDQSKSSFWDTDTLRILNNLYFQLHSMEENVLTLPGYNRDDVKSRLLFRNNYRWLLDYINQKANLILTERKMVIFRQIYQTNLENKIPLLAELTENYFTDSWELEKLWGDYDNPYCLLYWSLKLWEQDQEMKNILEIYFSAVIGRAILCEDNQDMLGELLGSEGFGNLDYEISDEMIMKYGLTSAGSGLSVHPWRISGIGTGSIDTAGVLQFPLTQKGHSSKGESIKAMLFFLMFINIQSQQQIQMSLEKKAGTNQVILNMFFPHDEERCLSISNLFWNTMRYEEFFSYIINAFDQAMENKNVAALVKLPVKEYTLALREDFRQWEKIYGSSDMLQLQNTEFIVKMIDNLREMRTGDEKILDDNQVQTVLKNIFDEMERCYQVQNEAYEACRREREKPEVMEIIKPYDIFKNSPWMKYWSEGNNQTAFAGMYVNYFRILYEHSEDYRDSGIPPTPIEVPERI